MVRDREKVIGGGVLSVLKYSIRPLYLIKKASWSDHLMFPVTQVPRLRWRFLDRMEQTDSDFA